MDATGAGARRAWRFGPSPSRGLARGTGLVGECRDAHAGHASRRRERPFAELPRAGGVVVDNVAVTYDSGTNVVKVDADDINETGVTVANARYGVLYVDTGTDSTSPLIAYVDFDGDQSATAGTVAITWHANGMATVTVA